jgi:hypothetical protein
MPPPSGVVPMSNFTPSSLLSIVVLVSSGVSPAASLVLDSLVLVLDDSLLLLEPLASTPSSSPDPVESLLASVRAKSETRRGMVGSLSTCPRASDEWGHFRVACVGTLNSDVIDDVFYRFDGFVRY